MKHPVARDEPVSVRPSQAVLWLSGALLTLLGLLTLFLVATHRQAVQTATLTTSNLVRVIESGLANDFERIEGLLAFIEREIAAQHRLHAAGGG